MDETLRIIQHLYDRDDGVPDMDDDALQREYEELQAVKGVLDKRKPASPDPEVVDRIVAAAGEATERSPSPTRDPQREERPARSRTTGPWRRIVRRTSAALAVVLLLAVGWWQFGDVSTSSAPSTASAPPAASESESEQQALDAAVQEAEPARRLDGAVRSASQLPDWDEGDDVVRLHRRIEILNARSTTSEWGNGSLLQTTEQQRP